MDNGEYLRSAEMAEEANYNMIDGLMNNMPKKKDKNAPRRSVLKRLRKHQQKIASQGKGQPQQQKAVEEEVIFHGDPSIWRVFFLSYFIK